MNIIKRLTVAPALIVAISGLTLTSAHASTEALSPEAVEALAVASCQPDPLHPLTVDEMSPLVNGAVDVEGVPGEITAHLFRALVTTEAGDQECTFGVLHRDAQARQVKFEGLVTLARADTVTETVQYASTSIDLGNMGKGKGVDAATSVSLGGFLTPADGAVADPTYTISLNRRSVEVVQIAASRPEKDAAGRLLQRQLKVAAQLEHKQLKAARGKHPDRAVAAAKRAYDRTVAAAQAAYDRATAPKSVSRPVSHPYTVTGSIALAG